MPAAHSPGPEPGATAFPPQRPALEEGGHRVAPAVPGGQRRHRHRDVGGQHRDDNVDIGALPSVDEPVDDLMEALVVFAFLSI
jgi:hypothetical protein